MPIPSADTAYAYPVAVSLASIPTGVRAYVAAVPVDAGIRGLLHKHGLQVGTRLTVLGVSPSSERLILVGAGEDHGRSMCLVEAIVDQIRVIPQGDVPDLADGACEESEHAPPHIKVIPLSQLKRDETGIIIRINRRGRIRQRLLDMGVMTGEEIVLKRRAPLGDPLEFTL